MKEYIVYKLTFSNQSTYVGTSCNSLRRRIRHHRANSKRSKYNSPILEAFRELELVKSEVLGTYKNQREAWDEEREQIAEQTKGLNVAPGGSPSQNAKNKNSTLGRRMTEEGRANLSKAMKGNSNAKGAVRSLEYRKKLSETRKGIAFSEEHKANIGKAARGRVVSEETRKRLSKAGKGRVLSDEARLKISLARKEYWKRRRAEESGK